MVIPHYLGRTGEIDITSENDLEENQNNVNPQNSFSSLSLLQAIPLLLPQEAEQENTASNSDRKLNHRVESSVCCESFLLHCTKSKAKDTHTQMRGFVDNVEYPCGDLEASVLGAMKQPGESDDDDILGGEFKQVGTRTSCRCQVREHIGIYPFKSCDFFSA